ncbi:hypothetical protein M406DRAFT_100944 [Cryphonectria parasitica EP155]|uniref:Uncharacterized protein n=1 Tax=Cryphonectria parasitica (strain ATCC 38755 / EP155) TaxID=660469 RepID=A0A9P5CUF0_CRYP1|nr:uncharacterized protein M406DRAFT_100944 [Cryphonectria parasitica EP155]KAF3770627.1 hypothetical protein M406DRAFT_100944 [Cryphonectria parasitica EP155]
MRLARSYQDKVDGPVNPLTTDSLRQISKITGQGGGARSATRSRGDSGYAPTNRNSIDMMDDMRILVKGTATLTIGDAQMDVKDGAEIRIPTSVGGDRNSRGGSDQGSSYADERERERDRDSRRPEEGGRRTRHERERLGGGGGGGTTTATQHARDRRATSRAGSHSRGYGHGHGQAIPASPYPLEYGGGSLGSHYYHSQPPLAYAPYGSHGFPYPS